MTPTHDIYLLPDTAGQEKWDRRFIAVAELVSTWSKDPSTKCGAVIVRPDRTIASVGYNGFPRGCSDADEIYADRPLKYARVVHAEVNSILAAREPLNGYTLYTSAVIIQSGITRVVHEYEELNDINSRWAETMRIGLQMYAEAHVEVVHR